MAKALKVLGIHGLGDHRNSPWAADWENIIRASLPTNDNVTLKFVSFSYDELFETVNISPRESLVALWKLAGSGLGLPRTLPSAPGSRGLIDSANHWLRWCAGYVVAWVEDEPFRKQVRQQLLDVLGSELPDLVVAHSLGSLISYDALSSDADLDLKRNALAKKHLPKLTYVTLGSQLANPFVIGNLTPGRIEPLQVKQWYHLFNPHDKVFTAPISLPGVVNFLQVRTEFDIEGIADHSAVEYLGHAAASRQVWTPVSLAKSKDPLDRALAKKMTRTMGLSRPSQPPKTQRNLRALLVGIDQYGDPAMNLAGCVNDVYLMSQTLQERGMPADSIRILLNERATASAILERLEWLVAGARSGDFLVFHYSGHGAQIPVYGSEEEVDKMNETLVPYNFDWSPETSITDDQIYRFYTQLPFGTGLMMNLDCCHAGGMHRDGGPRIRGLNPPPDIQHRFLRWNATEQMWQARKLEPFNRSFAPKNAKAQTVQRQYCGDSGAVLRLGRAMRFRQMTHNQFSREKQARRDTEFGPFLPVILEACTEDQLAAEYTHGAQHYGAYTYAMTEVLRRENPSSFVELKTLRQSEAEESARH